MSKKVQEFIKRGMNANTGRSYLIVRIVKQESYRLESDIGKYKVVLYGYADQWGDMDGVDMHTGIKQLVGANYFDDLEQAKVFAYNHMAYNGG